jgi:hypothetical protein
VTRLAAFVSLTIASPPFAIAREFNQLSAARKPGARTQGRGEVPFRKSDADRKIVLQATEGNTP